MDTTTNTSIVARCGDKNDKVYYWECKLSFIPILNFVTGEATANLKVLRLLKRW